MLAVVSRPVRMHTERTPNPDSLKWVLDRPLPGVGAGAGFDAAPLRALSPLAASLFEVDGVREVFLGPDFVTLTRSAGAQWEDLAEPVSERIGRFLVSGEPALCAEPLAPAAADGDEIEQRIRRVLDEEIRPAVAMDGGDVSFVAFSAGVVEVRLRGACSGCPSSAVTLRFGIEGRLRQAVPEVERVVAV